jgi:hypothetical protein
MASLVQNYKYRIGIGIGSIIILIVLCLVFAKGKNPDHFTNVSGKHISEPVDTRYYNPLYVSPDDSLPGSYIYTQSMGDTKAQAAGDSGQGTNGGFLPLQGIGAGVFMKNSSNQNLSLMSPNPGLIGGQPNYTDQQFSSAWIGFNNFGTPFQNERGPEINDKDYTDSYLIDGANQRVTNSGQKSTNLECQEWDPKVKKDSKGFCTQSSDAVVDCDAGTEENENNNLDICMKQGSIRFLESKMLPQWMKVL